METQTPTEQAPAPSVEDRIASIFGGGSPEPAQEAPQQETHEAASEAETPEGESPPAEETFDLEFEGEKFTLPKKLEKGFLQERDYTQKSQTLAEQRRAIELAQRNSHIAELQQQFLTDTQTEHQQLQALEWAIAQPVDWNSMTTEDAFRRKIQIDAWQTEKQRIEKVIGDKRKDWDQKQQESFTKLVRESLDVISKAIPGWGPDLAKQVTEHALKSGFTETELRKANTDPRLAVALWKAQQFDLLKAKATPTQTTGKAIKTTPSNPMPQQVKEKLAYRKAIQKAPRGSPEHRRLVEARAASIFSR